MFATWALSHNGVRTSVFDVIRHALQSKLIWVWLSLGVYATALILGLRELGVWHPGLVKATILWFAFTAVALPFQFGDAGGQPHVLRTLAKYGISVLILVEVLINTYTFSLPVEFLLVPVVTVVVLIGVVAETKPDLRGVERFAWTLQALIGFGIAGLALRSAIHDEGSGLLTALPETLLPMVLTFGMLPYVYVLRIFFAYESLLWRIGWKVEVRRRFRHYAAAHIMLHLRFRPTALKPFLQRSGLNLLWVNDRASLDAILVSDRQADAT